MEKRGIICFLVVTDFKQLQFRAPGVVCLYLHTVTSTSKQKQPMTNWLRSTSAQIVSGWICSCVIGKTHLSRVFLLFPVPEARLGPPLVAYTNPPPAAKLNPAVAPLIFNCPPFSSFFFHGHNNFRVFRFAVLSDGNDRIVMADNDRPCEVLGRVSFF